VCAHFRKSSRLSPAAGRLARLKQPAEIQQETGTLTSAIDRAQSSLHTFFSILEQPALFLHFLYFRHSLAACPPAALTAQRALQRGEARGRV